MPAELGGRGPRRVRAFGPGRINLIGEHTDYNEGLALPFAIAAGVRVDAEAIPPGADPEAGAHAHAGAGAAAAAAAAHVEARAADLGESDRFALTDPQRASGWRAYVRGLVVELTAAGIELDGGARLRIEGDVPRGAGMSSSAAFAVGVALALIELAGPDGAAAARDPLEVARLCSRVENEWVGARTGLLDQLASLCGEAGYALCIDFRSLLVEPVPLALGDWRLAVLDSGKQHELASSGYNDRRDECARASALLGVHSLRDADDDAIAQLPEPLARRARHVAGENRRVSEAVAVLRAGDLPALGRLLDASHASLRDLYEVSTPRVEATVAAMRAAGAAGARLIGGGFGGSVLGLFAPEASPPAQARGAPRDPARMPAPLPRALSRSDRLCRGGQHAASAPPERWQNHTQTRLATHRRNHA